jgi:hypothetical protein
MNKIKTSLSSLVFLALFVSSFGLFSKPVLASALAISITSPTINSTVSGTITVNALVTAGNASIKSVQFYFDSNTYGNPIYVPSSGSTYSLSMDTTAMSNAYHILTATVTDSSNATATASNLGFIVQNTVAYAAPSVSVSAAETNTSTTLNNGAYSSYVTLSAGVTPGSLNIQSVQFLLNGSDLSSPVTIPTSTNTYTYNWNTSSSQNAQYTVSAIVTDSAGHQVTATPITLTVNNSIVYGGILSAQLISPAPGVTIFGTNKLIAYVKQGGPAIQNVQFILNNADLGAAVTTSDTTLSAASGYSNYTYSWDTTTVTNGTYAITALVTDASGQTYTTTAVNVYVGNSSSTVSIVAPLSFSTVAGTSVVQTSVKAGTSSIKSVQLDLNGTNLGPAITAVGSDGYYSYSWDTTQTTNGTYTLTSTATDNAGLSSKFSITVYVNNSATTTPTVPPVTPPVASTNPSGLLQVPTGETPAAVAGAHANGTLVMIGGTYYEVGNGVLQGITTPAILSSLGFTFADAVPANTADQEMSQGTVALPSDGSLITSAGDPTIYLVSGQQRHPFVSGDVFTALGYKFSSVLNIDSGLANLLPLGSAISDPASWHLLGSDISNNGTVYWVGSDGLHPYTSLDVYNSWHLANDFSNVVPANAADLAWPVVSPVVARVKATT